MPGGIVRMDIGHQPEVAIIVAMLMKDGIGLLKLFDNFIERAQAMSNRAAMGRIAKPGKSRPALPRFFTCRR